MSAHTPGPWHWDSDAVKNDPYGRVRYRVCTLGKTITQVYYSSFEGGLTNADADARLIAAAPDLLEALIGLVGLERGTEWHEMGTHFRCPDCGATTAKPSDSEHNPNCPLIAARAAISKATGAKQ